MWYDFDKLILQYCVTGDSVAFWSSPVDGDPLASVLLNDFLFGLSENHEVFFSTYRLPDVNKIIEEGAILAKAGMLLDPFHDFFRLDKARVKSECLDWACETELFFFERGVTWEDYLTIASTADKRFRKRLRKSGLLSACFISCDYGSDLLFEGTKAHEGKLQELCGNLGELGWEIQRVKRPPVSNR